MRFRVGDRASYTQTISEAHVALFVGAVGDTNPLHVDEAYAKRSRFGGRIAQGILVAGLISTVIGTRLPGVGAIYLGQTLRFLKPVYLGDTITATAVLKAVREREKGGTSSRWTPSVRTRRGRGSSRGRPRCFTRNLRALGPRE
jgi:3-hydroxybutyryl-CoA dehydratase